VTFLASALLTYAVLEWFASPLNASPPTPSLAAIPATIEGYGPLEVSVPEVDPPEPTVLAAPQIPEAELPVVAESDPEDPPAEVAGPADYLSVVTGRIERGGTLGSSLRTEGVGADVVDLIARSMRPVFDFRYAHAGDSFALVRGDGGDVLSFEFQRGRRDLYRLVPDRDGQLVGRHEEVPLERRTVRLAGEIKSSLFEALVSLGEGPELVADFADMFAWDIDFAKEARPGDQFRVLFEKFYDREGFVRYGKLLAAEYEPRDRTLAAIYFEEDDGYGDYYRPSGTSVRGTFLRAPLRYRRISSRYSRSRLHPILKVRRPHEGVDYAAAHGTPVWAVADGTVIFRGWSGGFGKLVKLRHPTGYVSYYGHLSRYGNDVSVGSRVRQKQVIGYVGATGLATGAHLDYRLKVNGRFVDPLRVKLPQGEPIRVKNSVRFALVRDELLRELRNTAPTLTLEAARQLPDTSSAQ
jgi:murein DD-endopeptidase MepM/ murein hydrolase activator NlpD